jgi:lipopolysaccharide export system permease protein
MIKTFELYLIRLFLKKIFNSFIVFFALIFILNLFEEISFFKSSEVNFFFPVLIGGLNVPATIFEIFPFIFLISTQFFFLDIINKNELDILKTSGLSNIRILRTLFLTSFALGLMLVAGFYTLSSKSKFIYLDIKNSYSTDNKYLAVVKESGLWIKDEINNNILIITSNEIIGDLLIDVSIHEFDKDFNLIRVIQSKEADISNYEWVIKNALISKDNRTTRLNEEMTLLTHFDKVKINSMFSNLSSLNIPQLLRLRKDYKSLGYSSSSVDTHLHKLYSLPLFVSIMTIIVSIIMFNNKRNASIIFHLILGIFLSVIIYYLYFLFNLLGENGKMPIILSIYLPFVILVLIALIGMVKLNEK